MKSVKVVFAGTPNVALPSLSALVDSAHEIVQVISMPDAPLGRNRVMTPSPVSQMALDLALPLTRIRTFDGDTRELLTRIQPDIGIVVAFGALIPEDVLAIPAHGWLNLHFSRLPDLRGAAPLQRAVMRGDQDLYTTVFRLVPALDAGPILSIEKHTPPSPATASELLSTLAHTGARQLLDALDRISDGSARFQNQEGAPTYAAKLSLDDGRFRFDETGKQSFSRFRAVTSEPGFWFLDRDIRVKILDAHPSTIELQPGELAVVGGRTYLGTATTALHIERVHPAGKKPMNAGDWMRGRQLSE